VHDSPQPAMGGAAEEPPVQDFGPGVTLAAGGDRGYKRALNERQRWLLHELAKGLQLQRGDVERQFDVCARTAKRGLAILTELLLISFVRQPPPGHYRLRN